VSRENFMLYTPSLPEAASALEPRASAKSSSAGSLWTLRPRSFPRSPTRLGDYAASQLEKRGVDIRVETTLDSVEEHAATLSDGERIETDTLVWTAGVRAARSSAGSGFRWTRRDG
jgi:NADH dehydrogenase FAD-containing subunit